MLPGPGAAGPEHHTHHGEGPRVRVLGRPGPRPLRNSTGGAGGRALAEGDYLASWALLVGLGGAESPPAPAGPWLRASVGTLRVLRREEELQEHGAEGVGTHRVFS